MKTRWLLLFPALLVGLWSAPSIAAKAVRADSVVHLTRAHAPHRLLETARVSVPYGTAADTLGYLPGGPDRLAMAPDSFDVDDQGRLVVADPVRRRLFRIDVSTGHPSIAPVAPLPLPFSDVAVDRDGTIYVADLKSRTVTAIGGAVTHIPGDAFSMRFVRRGNRVMVRSGAVDQLLGQGAVTSSTSVAVEKCNAEAGLVTIGSKQVQIEIGGPLASIQLIGVSATGNVFLLFERFRTRGRLEVDRRIVVLDALGALSATMDVLDTPGLSPSREFVMSANGALHQMLPDTKGVTFVRWEVRP